MKRDASRIICELDCGCVFDAEDVFRTHPLARGRDCRGNGHAVFQESPIPTAAVVDGDRPSERLFAIPMPNAGGIMLIFDGGTIELKIEEARRLNDVLTGAIAIYDGEHPVQSGA